MQAKESSIEHACVRIAKESGCELLKIRGAKGWPDRLLIMPSGRMLFIELKREGGELSPLQREVFKKLHKMNVLCYEVDNVQLFRKLLSTKAVDAA